jgi:hypothetical protein
LSAHGKRKTPGNPIDKGFPGVSQAQLDRAGGAFSLYEIKREAVALSEG